MGLDLLSRFLISLELWLSVIAVCHLTFSLGASEYDERVDSSVHARNWNVVYSVGPVFGTSGKIGNDNIQKKN